MDGLVLLADVAVSSAALPIGFLGAYLGLLTALSGQPRERSAGGASPCAPRTRFVIVVPAHDEASTIGETLASLRAVDYPESLREVLVIADNCADDTATRALLAGAGVTERRSVFRGKGYALSHGFDLVLSSFDAVDAVVVVDADTVVSPGILRAFAARIEAGAVALQARYRVSNPGASWRTTLMAIALAAYHDVRSLGRERLGLSCGLRGNGMCFTTEALRRVPHAASSLVEDVEHGIELGLAGVRVAYVHDAVVSGQMVPGAAGSATQRLRWESGRTQMRRRHAPRLVLGGLRVASPLSLDLGLDLLVPPLGTVAVGLAAGLGASVAVSLGLGRVSVGAWLWSASALLLAVHVARGWQLSGTGAPGLLALLHIPGYVVWKFLLRARRSRDVETWVRTARDAVPPAAATREVGMVHGDPP